MECLFTFDISKRLLFDVLKSIDEVKNQLMNFQSSWCPEEEPIFKVRTIEGSRFNTSQIALFTTFTRMLKPLKILKREVLRHHRFNRK
ncbi:MAG: hypothetical protein N5P05_004449 (plasmid) [Chroococcopsis gigantea SAG 12.99]|nr:hypothetical protein [Chroococcopsis gigantea SAG 12.99]